MPGIALKVELRMNGNLEVRVTPLDGISRVVLGTMLAKAEHGQIVSLKQGEDGAMIFSMEAD